jgi:hypothetical protein
MHNISNPGLAYRGGDESGVSRYHTDIVNGYACTGMLYVY